MFGILFFVLAVAWILFPILTYGQLSRIEREMKTANERLYQIHSTLYRSARSEGQPQP